MARKAALVTGATGQDGRYATRLLLSAGYDVIGTSRDAAATSSEGIRILSCSLTDQQQLFDIVNDVRPSEIYNFAAFSTGSAMFDHPIEIGDVNGLAVTRILEAIRRVDPEIRLCQASSSEMYGDISPSPQNETTVFAPRSPYGAAKQYGHAMIDVYRQRHGLFACSAILFNHESPLRSPAFVTRKITQAAARISLGLADRLMLGSLDAERDWGFAGDYVRACHLMLRASTPRDYVVATGKLHAVRDICRIAFERVGLEYRDHVSTDVQAVRPRETAQLIGDPGLIGRTLGWVPEIDFEGLIEMMVTADLAEIKLQQEMTG